MKSNKMADFLNLWDEISTDPSVPQSFMQYLAKEWLQSPHMWARVARKNQSIFEKRETNMLIEVYVILHFLMIR